MNAEKQADTIVIPEPIRVVNRYPREEETSPKSSRDLKTVGLLSFENHLRYSAQSALSGLIEDRFYVPTAEEAHDIMAWVARGVRP